MNKIGTDIISFSVLLIGAIVMLCSCHDDSYPVPSSETEGMRRNLVISLTVQQPGLQSPTSRAPFDTGYELGFTEKECQIHTLTLIMMGVYNGEELFETWQTIEPSEPTNGIYDVQFTLSGITGTKHFYILANAEQKHINAFWAKDRIFDAGEGQSGHNIVGNLMEINHNENGDGEGSNILMAGIVKSNSGDRDIVIPTGDGNEDTDEKITIDTSANLVRTVAKVLLTCVPSPENNDYVAVIDSKDNADNTTGNTGWIKLAEVNYMLNVLNRKTYLDYREDTKDDGYLIDPNYEMSNWIEKRTNDNETTYGIKDLDAYQKEFLFYDTQDMVEMLNTSIPTYKGGEPCMVRTATLYDKNRIGKEYATSRDHYTEGLYCTENTVYKDMTFANEADFQSAIRYVTTRVMVGAKYTPKVIWDGGDEPKTAQTEKEAQEILEVEDVDNPLEPVTYPAGTFWRDSEGNYYSRAGMKEKLKKSPETEFSRYDGGWGYYYTYIDENAPNGAISKDQTRWGIKRNHYYILKVDKIIAPGSPFPGNETMRIHSELVDWVDKGDSEVEIKVPQQSETAQP
ncbi:Mfa1 family fimbria major subunit [Bacteroides gallinaceum]|uniref:Mfa1 family fimbria major subunit n=1 Tax=Bacteroides gallinaceum TaxID=1462571 RepID=UPI00195C54E2|nr:Mfa1 family fimbria major subunit [Bacteroides gallinaceum]MBM6718312.1 Mfa1 family fimbria major subunit [Bacteroides gallinaceum]